MKSLLATISIIGFVSVAVFGFLAIGHINEMAHSGCLAALVQNGACPSATSAPLASAFSHLNILRSFSSALLSNVVLLLALAVLSGIAFVSAKNPGDPAGFSEAESFLPRLLEKGENSLSLSLNWLALHFNSPASAVRA